jgi:hypothetical protein
MHDNYVCKFLQSFVTSPLSKSVASSALRVLTLAIYGILQNPAGEQAKQYSFYIGKDYEKPSRGLLFYCYLQLRAEEFGRHYYYSQDG